MNRRSFLASGLASGVVFSIARSSLAQSATALLKDDKCVLSLDQVTAEATGFTRYEHFHILAIPVSVLIKLPVEGYTTRTSVLDQDSLDVDAFEAFIKETGLPEALRTHSHEVTIKNSELMRIASGEKNVEITVLTPKGNLAHHFYFTASRSALVKIMKAKGKKA